MKREMNKIITDRALSDNLNKLREWVGRADNSRGKVAFMNTQGFVRFIASSTGESIRNVRACVTAIEPFIPLTIDAGNVAQLLDAVVSGDEKKAAETEAALIQSSRVKFLNQLTTADNLDWNNIVIICREIRTYLEKGI